MLHEDSFDWLELGLKFGESHRGRIVENSVNELGKEKLREVYRGVGSLAYPPELMLKMVLFEYLQGRTSPAQWHRDASEHDAMKWLGRGIQPSRTTWYDFRDRMDKVIHELNENLIRSAVDANLAHPEEAAQDGTTFRSNASRHQSFNNNGLEKRRAILEAAIERELQQMPTEEPQPKWMPKTRKGRWELHDRIEIAEQELERRLLENQEKPKDRRRLEKHIVVSLTDPIAPFARDKEKTFCFLYTTQFMVDADSLLVLDYSVAPENTDVGTLGPMIDRVQERIGGTLKTVSADAGYSSLLDLKDCFERKIELLAPVQENSFSSQKRGINSSKQICKDQFQWMAAEQTYRCPQGHRLFHQTKQQLPRHRGRYVIYHHYRCPPEFCTPCALRDLCTTNPAKGRVVKRMEGEELVNAQREKMQRDDVKAIYRKRSQTIERSFADAKAHRSFGKFHGRGLSRARAEVGLLVLAQNLLNLERLRRTAKNTEKQAA